MNRTAINPWDWSLQFGYNQGELIESPQRLLVCAGQAAIDPNGAPVHVGDIQGQFSDSLDNLEAVLAKAEMSIADVIRLTIYTTDVDGILQNYGVLTQRLEAANVRPTATLLGVARLAFPELLVEIEATAAQ